MKRFLPFFLLCGSAFGATPTLVQATHWASSYAEAGNDFKLTLPNAVLANNLLVIACHYPFNAGRTVAWTDNIGGNTYTSGITKNDGTTTHTIFYSLNTAAGTQKLNLHFDTSLTFVQCSMSEWYNVATSTATDGTASASGVANTSIATGVITTAVDGDLIIQYASDESRNNNTIGWTAGGSFALLSAGTSLVQDGDASQYLIQSTHGSSLNPTFSATMDASTDNFGTVAIAFKSASAGTAPSATGIRIVEMTQFNGSGTAATYNWVFPCSGTTIAVTGDTPTSQGSISSLVDSGAVNTFTKKLPGTNTPQIWLADAATCTRSLHGTYATSGGSPTLFTFYSIIGAATSAFDKVTSNTGVAQTVTNLTVSSVDNASGGTALYHGTFTGCGSGACNGFHFQVLGFTTAANNGPDFVASSTTATQMLLANASATSETHAAKIYQNQLDSPDITPATSNGLVIWVAFQGTGPGNGIANVSGSIYTMPFYTGMTDASQASNGDQSGHLYNPNTNALAFTITMVNAGTSSAGSGAMALKAAPASGVVRRRASVISQ